MNQIQKWIAALAGVTQAERARYEFAREFFGRRLFDTSRRHVETGLANAGQRVLPVLPADMPEVLYCMLIGGYKTSVHIN